MSRHKHGRHNRNRNQRPDEANVETQAPLNERHNRNSNQIDHEANLAIQAPLNEQKDSERYKHTKTGLGSWLVGVGTGIVGSALGLGVYGYLNRDPESKLDKAYNIPNPTILLPLAASVVTVLTVGANVAYYNLIAQRDKHDTKRDAKKDKNITELTSKLEAAQQKNVEKDTDINRLTNELDAPSKKGKGRGRNNKSNRGNTHVTPNQIHSYNQSDYRNHPTTPHQQQHNFDASAYPSSLQTPQPQTVGYYPADSAGQGSYPQDDTSHLSDLSINPRSRPTTPHQQQHNFNASAYPPSLQTPRPQTGGYYPPDFVDQTSYLQNDTSYHTDRPVTPYGEEEFFGTNHLQPSTYPTSLQTPQLQRGGVYPPDFARQPFHQIDEIEMHTLASNRSPQPRSLVHHSNNPHSQVSSHQPTHLSASQSQAHEYENLAPYQQGNNVMGSQDSLGYDDHDGPTSSLSNSQATQQGQRGGHGGRGGHAGDRGRGGNNRSYNAYDESNA